MLQKHEKLKQKQVKRSILLNLQSCQILGQQIRKTVVQKYRKVQAQ